MALRTVGISIDVSGVVLIVFPFPWRTVDAKIEDPASSEGRETRLDGGGFSNSLHRALGLIV